MQNNQKELNSRALDRRVPHVKRSAGHTQFLCQVPRPAQRSLALETHESNSPIDRLTDL